jgi:hypothetical protein
LEWSYLKGDGDFRSDEIKKLRDEADIIITNPPFSLFREFLSWIIEANRQFVLIGSMNAITYKEIFALLKADKMWLGNGFKAGNAYFASPLSKDYASLSKFVFFFNQLETFFKVLSIITAVGHSFILLRGY